MERSDEGFVWTIKGRKTNRTFVFVLVPLTGDTFKRATQPHCQNVPLEDEADFLHHKRRTGGSVHEEIRLYLGIFLLKEIQETPKRTRAESRGVRAEG